MSTHVTADFSVDHLHKILGFEMSEEQLAAVTADLSRPLLVVAGAGSGKTTVMAARVLWAVATGQVRPEQIVGLTFTRKAAGELGARVRHLLDVLFDDYPPRSVTDVDTGTPTVSTYHSFAHQFVAEHGLRIGVEPGARLLSETESLQIAYRVLLNTALPLTDMGVAAPTLTEAVVKLDQQLSEHVCTPAQLRAHERAIIERIDTLPKTVADDRKLRDVCARRLQLCDVVEEFRAEKAQQAVVDFADVLRLGHELAARQDVQEIFHDQVKMVLLDEYQDTSVVQSELLAPLIGSTNSVTAVGDPLQAIYGWRGAGANAMADFSKHFAAIPGSDAQRAINVLPLSISQRSGPNVLAVANDIAAPLRRDSGDGQSAQVVTLRSGAGRDGLPRRDGVRAAVFETYVQEVRWLGDRIAEQVNAGTEPSEIAVLCRARSDFAAVLDELRARGIPAVVSGSEGLLAQPEVIDVISMLEVASDPTSNPAMLRILLGPRIRLGPRDLALLGRLASELARKDRLPTAEPDVRAEVDFTESIRGIDRADLVSLAEAIDALSDHPDYPISVEGRARVERLAVELRLTRESIGLPLSDLVSRVIALIGLDVEARLEAMTATSNRSTLAQRGIAALQALHELVSTAQESADGASLAGFLSWISVMQRVKREPEFDVPLPADAVSIMTVHKSKGLEWEVVAVPFLSETVFPNGRAPDRWTSNIRELPHVLRGDRDSLPELKGFGTHAYKEFNEELAELNGGEERRLGYVAVTRPTRLLLASGHWWGPTQTRKRGASYLLRAVRDSHADPPDTDEWVAETVHEENPQTAATSVVTWPPNLDTPTRERRL
ncbi:MAG: ATP-dependent helicase, partial [Candidatus Nanopelagicales bacterium]